MVAEKDYSALPKQQAYKISSDAAPILQEGNTSDDGTGMMEIRSLALSNDIIATYTSGDPGDVVPWHSHSPEMYQILYNVEGECRWYYKDNSNTMKEIEGGPGDAIYLPAGAENKVEVIGDEHHLHIGMLKRPRVPRLEHLLGETEHLYEHHEFPSAFVYDDMNDRLIRSVEEAVSTE